MQKLLLTGTLLLAAGFVLTATPAVAASGGLVAANCTGCHQSENGQIWGMMKPGSQTDSSFAIEVDGQVWQISYDQQTKLKKFISAKQLRDDKAVTVVPRKVTGNTIVAASVAYKDSIDFMTPDMVIEIDDLSNLIKQDPKVANYVVFDVRGYGDYIDGHLPGAVSLPYYRMIKFKDRLPEDKSTQIITYCNSYG